MKERNLTFKRFVGDKGEDSAVKLLEEKGFTIISRNYTVHNVGEIDIIAEKGGDIHILEVRTRQNRGTYPDSAESVTASKRRKVMKTADYYVMENNLYDRNIIFEVAMVTHDKQGNILRVDFVPF
ncbi:MAG: YraN family protein [Clostridiales bacterium]|nr:YraN family protein [Clostridiales bacterium]